MCESPEERRYRIRDFWSSHIWFEVFRERFAAECDKFNLLIVNDGLVEKQELVGTYYETGDGGDFVLSGS
jgi:hypothetical protein